jgi:hypothetical protein
MQAVAHAITALGAGAVPTLSTRATRPVAAMKAGASPKVANRVGP